MYTFAKSAKHGRLTPLRQIATRARAQAILIAIRAFEILSKDLLAPSRAIALVANEEAPTAALVAMPLVGLDLTPTLMIQTIRLQCRCELAFVVECLEVGQTTYQLTIRVKLR